MTIGYLAPPIGQQPELILLEDGIISCYVVITTYIRPLGGAMYTSIFHGAIFRTCLSTVATCVLVLVLVTGAASGHSVKSNPKNTCLQSASAAVLDGYKNPPLIKPSKPLKL